MRTVIRGLAELLVTIGLVLGLMVAHLVWGTGDYTRREQGGLRDELAREWGDTAPGRDTAPGSTGGLGDRTPVGRPADSAPVRTTALSAGRPFAIIRIPRFGAAYRWAVVEGVTVADLRKGPGHYPGSARPGEIGNMVLSGHRTTYGAPFSRLGELVTGDQIIIETASGTFAYRVTGRTIVRPTTLSVTAPVPLRPGRRARDRMLSLTTCHPKFSAAYRLVVFAELPDRRTGSTQVSLLSSR